MSENALCNSFYNPLQFNNYRIKVIRLTSRRCINEALDVGWKRVISVSTRHNSALKREVATWLVNVALFKVSPKAKIHICKRKKR